MEQHWQPCCVPNLGLTNLIAHSQLTRLKASSHHCNIMSHQALTTLHSSQVFLRPVVLLTAGLWPQVAKACGQKLGAKSKREAHVAERLPLWSHTSKKRERWNGPAQSRNQSFMQNCKIRSVFDALLEAVLVTVGRGFRPRGPQTTSMLTNVVRTLRLNWGVVGSAPTKSPVACRSESRHCKAVLERGKP